MKRATGKSCYFSLSPAKRHWLLIRELSAAHRLVQPNGVQHLESVRRVGIIVRRLAFKTQHVHQGYAFQVRIDNANWVQAAFFRPVTNVVAGALASVEAAGVFDEGRVARGFGEREVGDFVWHEVKI